MAQLTSVTRLLSPANPPPDGDVLEGVRIVKVKAGKESPEKFLVCCDWGWAETIPATSLDLKNAQGVGLAISAACRGHAAVVVIL